MDPRPEGLLGDDVTTINTADRISELSGRCPSDPNGRAQTLSYFILTVLGFSFWFFMVVPFASHRETYSWLAGVDTQAFAQQFSFGQTSTYRPLAQIATWLGFRFLDPRVFPTSVLRQALLQGFVYAMFALAWWFIYSAAPQRRLFAMVACVAGGVFFSGYVQLFHIYGLFYVPVVLTLGALLGFHASGTFGKREVWFAVVATVLVFWHPFATALFVGFYFGFCLDTFRRRSRLQHVQSLVILFVGMAAIAAMVVIFPRTHMPLDTKLFGFLVSYQTNEVNRVASFVAFLLTLLVIFSMGLSPRLRLAAILFASALSVVFLLKSLPLLFLWLFAVLIKLFRLRCWSLFFLALTAALLPFGGGIGTPIYALFAIIVAVYVTPLGWSQAEQALSFFKPRYVVGALVASAIVILLVRVGIQVPIVTRVASPLLAERERTYQLENILAWLHNSDYCGYDIAFDQNAGSPIEDVESAITRRNRPPAALDDVQLFWKTVLQCQKAGRSNDNEESATVTFGEPALANFQPVFAVKSRYAGDAVVWIRDSQAITPFPSIVSGR
ncbi:MAG: hypothetical protein ACLQMT_00585 [Candidatus Acidiferrales bacterium]